MSKSTSLRHVKEHNADPRISFNLKFRNNDLNMSKVGYVIGYSNGNFRHVLNKKEAERIFIEDLAGEQSGQDRQEEQDQFNEPGGHY